MDKSWTLESRVSIAYEEGVKQFLDFAFANAKSRERIKCPCKNCSNVYYRSRDEVYEHLICDGFEKGHGCGVWVFHGETFASPHQRSPNATLDEDVSDEVDDIHGMLRSAFGIQDPESSSQEPEEEPNAEAMKFYKLVEDADQELYPGCKNFTKLAFVVRLYHIKCLTRWSDKSFTMLLELLKEAFPEGETLPKSFYETKKIIGELGLGYNKIDACPNDCMLYWKEAAKEFACSVCGTSRWKANDDSASPSCSKEQKFPAKIVRHFPLKPRLQRLFMSNRTASLMRWHAEGRTNDGVLRHPADSKAWQNLDDRYPNFAAEPRNVRLGLASDGFNPFGAMSIAHSIWPVVLMPYNLPPWMCHERLLSSYLGVIARDGQKAPLTYSDWRRMPAERTADMWQAVQAKFDLGNNERTKRWVYIAISRSWRNWKASLKKKYYNPYHTIRERLLYCPARVNPDQWASLVTFWGSQEGLARSRRNSINREAQTMSHTAGTKSFAQIRDEARARNPDGQVPDRMEVFRMTHTRRDG